MHRDTTRELIERVRRDSELGDGVLVSIDITKSVRIERNGKSSLTRTGT